MDLEILLETFRINLQSTRVLKKSHILYSYIGTIIIIQRVCVEFSMNLGIHVNSGVPERKCVFRYIQN